MEYGAKIRKRDNTNTSDYGAKVITRNQRANNFFKAASDSTKGITDLLNQKENIDKVRNIQNKRTEINNLLSRAEEVRNQFANNKSMVKSIDSATDYLKNIDNELDKRLPKFKGQELSPDPKKNAQNDIRNWEEQRQRKIQNRYNETRNWYDETKGLSFEEITDRQIKNTLKINDRNRSVLENENQWLENFKGEKAKDSDYTKITSYADEKIKQLENQKKSRLEEKKRKTIGNVGTYSDARSLKNAGNISVDTDDLDKEIRAWRQVKNGYENYSKYGKSNIESWEKELEGLSYDERKQYIRELDDADKNKKEYMTQYAKNNITSFEDLQQLKNEYEAKRKEYMDQEERLAMLDEESPDKIYEPGKSVDIESEQKKAEKLSKELDEIGTLWKENESKYLAAKQENSFFQLPKKAQNSILDMERSLADKTLEEKAKYLGLEIDKNGEVPRNVVSSVETQYDNRIKEDKAKILSQYNLSEKETEDILSYSERAVNQERAEKEQEEWERFGRRHEKLATAVSVPMNVASGTGIVSNIWQNLKNMVSDNPQPVDYNTSLMRIGQNVNAVRQGVKENIESEVGQFVYDTFTSMGDSVATLPLNALVPGATTVLLGSSAATQAMVDAHDRGASDSQALLTGIGSGIFEGLFEKYSLDKIVDTSTGLENIKSYLQGVAKSMGVEASEEALTEISNITLDELVNGKASNHNQAIQRYLDEGYTKSEAKSKALKEMAIQVAQSAAGGALGGAFFSVPLGGINYVRNSSYREMNKKGENIVNNDIFTDLEEHIKENYAPDSEVYQQMLNTDRKNSEQVGYLANVAEMQEHLKAGESYREALEPAVSERLKELNMPKEEAEQTAHNIVNNMRSGTSGKNIEPEGYAKEYQQIRKEIKEALKGKTNELTEKMDVSEQERHLNNAEMIKKLGRGESFQQEEIKSTEEKINGIITEKQQDGSVIVKGKPHLIENPDVSFDVVNLAVGKEGETQAVTDDGRRFKMEDVAADKDTTALYELGEEYTPEQRKKFFRAYEQSSCNISPVVFAVNFNTAYQYGVKNLGAESALRNQRLNAVLTLDQIGMAYDAGKIEFQRRLQEENKTVVKGQKRGQVRYDKVNVQNLNETQKAAVDVAEILTQVTGVNYEFFESSQDEQGKYVGENGSYNRNTNTIRIDINSGMKSSTEGNNIMIVTLAHELTHYIESLSPNQYAKLQEFAFEKLSEATGQDINELIHIEKNRIKRSRAKNEMAPLNKRELTETAKSELVARSFEGMLTDAKAVKQLAQQDVGLFNKLKNKVMEFISKIEKACRELLDKDGKYKKGTVSEEARTLQKYAKEMRELWMDALKDAGENTRKNEDNTNIEVKNQLRENYKADIENWYKSKNRDERLKDGGRFLIGKTSDALKSINIKDFNIYFGKSKIQKILDKHQEMTLALIKQAPELLEKPIIVMDSLTRQDSLVILGELYTKKGIPVMLSLLVDPKNKKGSVENFGIITNAYNKDNVERYQKIINQSKIRYIESDKKRTNTWLSALGLQLPSAITKYGSISKISLEDGFVNISQNSKKNNNILNQNRNIFDSEGNELTKQQQEYFKDSKVRDKNGKLKVVYHGTNADFNVFSYDHIGDTGISEGVGFYFTDDMEISKRYGNKGKEVYLDIKKPVSTNKVTLTRQNLIDIMNDMGETAEELLWDYGDIGSYGKEAVMNKAINNWFEYAESDREIIDTISYDSDIETAFKSIRKITGHDGIIVENYNNSGSTVYVVFNQNQIKNVSNKNPTENEGIRYQDRDTEGEQLTEKQQEFFKNSKVRDSKGRLMVMYHGTPTGEFTVFRNDLQFFTDNKDYATFYESPSASSRKAGKKATNPQTYEVYLNIEKPFDTREAETKDLFVNEYVKGGWALGINPYTEYQETTSTGLPSWEEADNIYEFLEENNMLDQYDGIIVDEGGYEGKDGTVNRGIAYVAFYPEQIKNKNNESPTNNEDIRYQERYREPRTYEEALKQNKEYREIIENLKEQFRITKGHRVGEKGINRITSRLIKETNTSLERADLKKEINRIFNESVQEKMTTEQTMEALKGVVYTALNNRRENYKITDYSKGILDKLRTTPVKLSEAQKRELEYTTGQSYNEWRKSMFGKLRLNKNGTPLDILWEELSSMYPVTFERETNWRDQASVLQNIIYDLQNDFENNYGFDFEDAAEYISADLLSEYNSLPEVMTYADRQQAKLKRQQQEYREKMSDLKKKYSDMYKEYQEKSKKEIAEARKKWKEDQKYREENLKYKYGAMIRQREANIRNRENSVWQTREKEKIRNHIIRKVKSISGMVVKPTNQRHAPEGFKAKTAEFCQEFLKNTSVFSYDDLDRLKIAYEALRVSEDNMNLQGSYDADIEGMLFTLRQTMGNKRLAQLTRIELEQVKDIVDHFAFIIENENRLWVDGKSQELYDMGNEVLSELDAKGERTVTRTANDKVNTVIDKAEKSLFDNCTPIYYFKRLGKTFSKLYDDVRKGQDKWGKNIKLAADFIKETKQKYHYDKWEKRTLKLGDEIELSLEEVMYVYATAKREQMNTLQKAEHLAKGGIILERGIVKEGKLLRKEKTQAQSYKIHNSDLARISSFLTMEQKRYVDAVVKYLSVDMAALGNETSMQLYGYKKFGESYYFPYKVSESEKKTTADKKSDVTPTLKNVSFSKSVVKRADSAVTIGEFTKTAAEHISAMCTYNALAVAQDNINKVYNFKDIRWDEEAQMKVGSGKTVKQLMKNTMGKKANTYMKNFLSSINNGIQSDSREDLPMYLIGKFKKSAVYASFSVMIQQPSAICRAFALVNPKYFAQTTFTKRDWEECKKYNGVAVVKELGGFDIGVGQKTTDYLTDEKADTKVGRAVNKLDEGLGKLPGWMDQITWCHIWNAVKQETKAKYNFGGTEREFWEKASERFDEVINLTQVYDSVLAKSANMNSGSAFMKSATAFMSEPTLTFNMAVDAVRSKKASYMTKALSSIIIQTIVNSALKALVQAARNTKDEDADKSYVEKYVKAFTSGTVNDINPLTWIPFVKDVISIAEGYDVERMDMTLLADLYDANVTLVKTISGKGSKTQSDAIWQMSESLAAFFGVPLRNIRRDTKGLLNVYHDAISNNVFTTDNMTKAFLEGLGITTTNADIVRKYISSGDEEVIEELFEKKQKEIREKYPAYSKKKVDEQAWSGIRGLVTKELKEKYLSGNQAEKKDVIQFMKKSGLYMEVKKGKRKVDASEETVTDWEVNELKKQYLNLGNDLKNFDARKEVRKKLYKTGKWKTLRALDKQLKEWTGN